MQDLIAAIRHYLNLSEQSSSQPNRKVSEALILRETADLVSSDESDDHLLASLSLVVTQIFHELSADAILLIDSDQAIVTSVGHLPVSELEELSRLIGSDWFAADGTARIRFVSLDSGKDFMLYTRKTVADLYLTMFWSGSIPMQDIRKQSQKLIEALNESPGQ